ncbi:hypothetical protein KL930_004091 [Ogataea haglerorum]|nr:hypothetical protein KL915_004205 [Ogataea haglerorum]KAG7694289.1 hypothetical protein KL951_004167 [Ogataea haglerorum]KAG7712011.1 hypothetical protein KL914_000653 [Ogataea haglerorum]KAG7712783.1 hypothetical protein KL950_000654 [Ogataea haglerorum]KAG7745084.1 hypothetical protein KL932_000114 [Ogataea haglerorum]
MEIAHESGLLALAASARPRKRLRPCTEVISLVSSEGQSFDDELEVTNSTDSENELSEDNIGLEAARRSQAHDSQSGTQNGAPRRSPHGSPHSKSREPSTTSIAHSAAQDSPHLELSHISVHSQSSSEPANPPHVSILYIPT